MTKEQLLRELKDDTWVCLSPSSVHGVGVFAIRNIPKGCKTMFKLGCEDFVDITNSELCNLPWETVELIDRYCIYDKDKDAYSIPNYGFKITDLVNYLNHSEDPNVISINNGEVFEAIKDIKKGDELLIDYDVITDDSDLHKK